MNRAKNFVFVIALVITSIGVNATAQDLESSVLSSGGGTTDEWFNQSLRSSRGATGFTNPDTGRIFDQHYFSLFGGFTNVDNFDRILRTPTERFIDGAKLRSGSAFGGSIGGVVREFVRSEFEFTFRDTDVSSFFNQVYDEDNLLIVNDREAATGGINSYSGMFNVLFDVSTRSPGLPQIYLGGGLGALYADGDFSTAAEGFSVQDSSFAYQFIAGVNYSLNNAIDLYTEYRYLGADNLGVENLTLDESLGDFTFDSHNVFFGLRVRR